MRPIGKSLRIEDVPAKVERKTEAAQPVQPLGATGVFELPVPVRVAPGKYNLVMVPIDASKLTGGRIVEREQGMGIVRAAMLVALRRAGDAYLKAVFG